MRSGTSTALAKWRCNHRFGLSTKPKDNYFPLKPFHYVKRLFLTDLRPPLPPPHLPLKRNPACHEMAVSPSALCWSLCCRWCVCVFARVKHAGRKCLRAARQFIQATLCRASHSALPSHLSTYCDFQLSFPGLTKALCHTQTHTHVRMHQVS